MPRLFRNGHHQRPFRPSSLRLFGTCSYKPIPKDLPSSSIQHRALPSTFLTQPRDQSFGRSACSVERDPVMLQFHDGGVITHNGTIKTPLVTQNRREEKWVGAR